MFGSSKSNKPQNRIDCLIGAGTTINGDINFSGGLRVDGHVRGNVISAEDKPGTLVLSDQARIEGEIRVAHAVINGTVVGPVNAVEYVELQGKANVTGDVHYRTLEIQLGAVVQGRLVYQPEGKSDKVVPIKPAVAE
ncbi:MAG: polymer-forming cytoskeletal family protein [Betaproteobacteria bacterium]|jgi:cytoskeletal protein CcmA (bactofilin family)|nr:polymer-forming cytoskeletal family protein [Betaproteobacteria bacterium]